MDKRRSETVENTEMGSIHGNSVLGMCIFVITDIKNSRYALKQLKPGHSLCIHYVSSKLENHR
jgi:hypothetical protein